MEWHTNGITPRILMPRSMTIKKIEELIRKNESLFGAHDWLNIMENVVYELADFFQVSRIAAKRGTILLTIDLQIQILFDILIG